MLLQQAQEEHDNAMAPLPVTLLQAKDEHNHAMVALDSVDQDTDGYVHGSALAHIHNQVDLLRPSMYLTQIVPVIEAGSLPVSPACGGHNGRTKAHVLNDMRANACVRRFAAALRSTLSAADADAGTSPAA